MPKVPNGRALRGGIARMCAVSFAWLAYQTGICVAQPSLPKTASMGHRESTIGIIPQASRVCPGQTVDATYVQRSSDGSRINLSPSDLKQTSPSDAESATMRRDGSWQTSADPMRSVLTGFRLSVTLARDSSVRGDTVVAPAYNCPRATIRLPMGDQRHPTVAYVRLGTFDTPFYDSVVVAVVEVESRVVSIQVLSPKEMRAGAISISAPGKNGAAGRNGRRGADGVDCSKGDDGEDGEPGEPGQPGGEVDIITQGGSPWLADLVAVSNAGGRGGSGGAGGAGGSTGVVGRTSGGRGSAACTARAGRPGRTGRPGLDGPPGSSKVTSVLTPLLWTGSPIWSDATARRTIEGLMSYQRK